jgi:hypothetical protein
MNMFLLHLHPERASKGKKKSDSTFVLLALDPLPV